MTDLSIVIPSRNEMFLARTIQDILEHIEGDTEIIAVLDGAWADPPIPQHPRVTVIYHSESVGQRAGSNDAVKLSSAKYVMKVDAHCAFDQGFDVKLMSQMQDDWTVVPVMRNLHAFNWRCPNGHTRYQSPSGPCTDVVDGKPCGLPTVRDVVWIPKTSPQSRSYRFDATPHFQYFGEYTKRQPDPGEMTETMSLQGSCFMLTRERYLALNICDEAAGSWGSQGIEVACKTWLSGGRVLVNNSTWYAHLFRTQGGDFSFPYHMNGHQAEFAKTYMRDLFFNNRWEHQVRPLSWLIERFKPVPGWHDGTDDGALERVTAAGVEWETRRAQPVPALPPLSQPIAKMLEPIEEANPVESAASTTATRGIIFYTDNQLDESIAAPVRKQLLRSTGLPIISASLKRMDFGSKNIRFPSLKRGHLSMFKQIYSALENSTSDIIFFTEHDVIYHPSHFAFIPPTDDRFYYNVNVWQVRAEDGHCIYYFCRKLSQMCCYRTLALAHFKKKIAIVEANDGKYDAKFGFEPGTRPTRHGGIDDSTCGDWRSDVPNIDIRHPGTLSRSKWSPSDFRNQSNNRDWQEGDSVPGWGVMAGRFGEFLAGLGA